MKPTIEATSFGSITVDGERIGHDIIIRLDGALKKRKKKLSKRVYGTSHRISLAEAQHVFEEGAQLLIIGAGQSYLFLRCSTFEHVTLLAVFTTLTNAFLNPAFQSLFADMTPRQHRGRVLATIGGGGIWLMRGAWGSGVLGRTTQTIGSFLSGFLYGYNNALPWTILSIALFALGVMFITWVQEPEISEI